jgi:hypothetical protein
MESQPGWTGPALLFLRAMLVGVICLQVALGFVNGLSGSRTAYQTLVVSTDVLANIDHASDRQVQYCLNGLDSPARLRAQASFLKKHRLGVFGTGEAERYVKEGLPPRLSCG